MPVGVSNTIYFITKVEGLTGIFCSISDIPGTYLRKPIFDRRIDLNWFGYDQYEFVRSKSQQIGFRPKIRPKISVFVTFEAVNFNVLISKFAQLLCQR